MNVITKNTPAAFSWLKPDEQVFRAKSREYLDTAIQIGVIGRGKLINCELFSKGESSVVYKVTVEDGIRVVKIADHEKPLRPVGFCLSAWANAGVKTPAIINYREEDATLPASLLVMEYVDSPVLSDLYKASEMVRAGITFNLGKMHALCHKVITGGGWGYMYFEKDTPFGMYETFTQEAETRFLGNRIKSLMDTGLLTEKHVDLTKKAVEALEDDILHNGIAPVLTHNDFRPYNVFATKPLTLFDPNPLSTHPYMCLALSLLRSLFDEKIDEMDAWLAGYESVTPVRKDVLRQAMLIRSIGMMHTWQKKGKEADLRKLLDLYEKIAE